MPLKGTKVDTKLSDHGLLIAKSGYTRQRFS